MTRGSVVDAASGSGGGDGAVQPADLDGAAVRNGRGERWALAPVRRPTLAVALAGIVVGAVNITWIARHREQGGFDGDESSYLTSAFTLRRALADGGPDGWLLEAIRNYRNGPLVPALSSLTMRSGDTITTAMAVQPLFHLVIAVGVCATVRRVAGNRPALVAGLVALGVPGLLVSARSYQLVLGATAAMVLAVWALVCSDRGRSTPYVVLFGALVGVMLLSRTMTVTFLPGLVVGAAIVVGHTRRAIAQLALAAAAALLVAGPWWIHEWSNSIAPYLFRYGYGQGAGDLGPASPVLRVLVRGGLVMTDVRPLLIVPALVVLGAAVGPARRAAAATGLGAMLARHRELTAVWSIVILGWISLLTSSNTGTYFQLPLEVVALIGIASLPVSGRWVRAAATWALVAAALNVLLLSNVSFLASHKVGGASLSVAAFGGVEVSQMIDFENGDARFAPGRGEDDRKAAMAEWAAAHDATAFAVDALNPSGEPMIQTFLGDIRLFQVTTLTLAEELKAMGRSRWEAPTATSTIGDGAVDLRPLDGGGRPRVLVAVRATTYTTQEGVPADAVLSRAADLGWYIARTVPLPDGGQVELWIHPDNAAFHGTGS